MSLSSRHQETGQPGPGDGWRTELTIALNQPELVLPELNTEPAQRAAYWLAVVLGHCRVEGVELGAMNGSLPVTVALAAGQRLGWLLSGWTRDAEDMEKQLEEAEGEVEANELCFELLEARVQAWAAYVAVD